MAVNVRLKHSSIDSKSPVAADLLEGEVALNINANSPAAYIKDSNGDIVKLAGAGSVTDATNVKKVGDTMTGPLVLSGDPTADDQASNKKYVDDSFLAGGVSKYVEVSGDNMTGDLTLGTDKITLDATGGSVTAAGSISSDTGGFYRTGECGIVFSGNSIVPTDGNGAPNNTLNNLGTNTKQFKDGYFYGKVTTGSITAADGDILLNSDGSGSFGDGNIVLRADGSAEFSGGVKAVNGTAPSNKTAFVQVAGSNDEGLQISDGTTANIQLAWDGSATFKGVVQSTFFDCKSDRSGSNNISRWDSAEGVEVIKFGADGSAEFASGGFKIDGNGYIQSNIQSAGLLQLDHTAAFTSPKIELSSVTGNATFVGRVKAADFSAGSTDYTEPYCYIGPEEITLNASSISPLFKVDSGGNIIKAGSATFDGNVTAPNVTFNLEADDDTKYDVTTEEYTETETYTVEVPVLRPEGVVGTADLVDEPKTRTITKEREVTKTREVRTYNGAVLDVKDELQSLRSRATQQDETIALMTAALKSLGIDTASFPSPEEEEPKTRSRKKK